jgi:hypothetical protein
MEEIEISSWIILDAIKNAAEIVDTVGDLQSGHWQSIFCTVEDDHLELGYVDTASSFLRRFEDKEEFQFAMEKRKEDTGELPYEENNFDEEFEDDSGQDDFEYDDESESF